MMACAIAASVGIIRVAVNTTDGSPSVATATGVHFADTQNAKNDVAPAAGLPPAQIAGIGLIIKWD
jgi:hypothetical protein